MMVQLKIKHRKFIMSQLEIYCLIILLWLYLLKQSIHIENSTKNTFIVHLQVDINMLNVGRRIRGGIGDWELG